MVALPWLLQVVGNSVGADQSRPHATTGKRALVWVWAHKCSTDSLVQSTERTGVRLGCQLATHSRKAATSSPLFLLENAVP